MHDQRINLDNLNLSGMARGIVSSIDDIRDHNFFANGLASLPFPLQARVARKYVERYNENSPKLKYKANSWFRRTIQKLKPRFNVLFSITKNMPLPWHILSNKDKTKNYAGKTVSDIVYLLQETPSDMGNANYETILRASFEAAGEHALTLTVEPKFWHSRNDMPIEALEISLLKMQCEKWWATKLKTVRARYLELLEIATGQVGKDLYYVKNTKKKQSRGISPYSSKQAQSEFRDSQKSGREYLDKLELQNEQGDVINLLQAVDAGMANPVNRRNELMLRIRETEELATEMGYVGVFYTMTCPSKYHANSDKWQGATPKQAQSYLVKIWGRARSKLARYNLNYFGIRVAEPHADGCPHWHMLLFMPKKNIQTMNAIIRKYFIAEDVTELRNRYGALSTKLRSHTNIVRNQNNTGVIYQYSEFTKPCRYNEEKTKLYKAYRAKRQVWGHKKSQGIKAKAPTKFYRTFTPRFDVQLIDPKKGSAAGYIAKYISKNIDGFNVTDHEDAETGELIKVNPVLAWASTWGIRQFQFQGSPSVTVYRELRRVREPVEQFDLERIRQAADQSQWKEFVNLMGGMCIGRNANFKTAYEVTPMGNKYAETVKKIKGVHTSTCPIAQALREMRGQVSVFEDASLLTRVTQWTKQLKGTAEKLAAQEQGFVGFADQSWTSGNNCTPLSSGVATMQRLDHKLSSLGLTESQIIALKNGQKVRVPHKTGSTSPTDIEKDLFYQVQGHEIRTFNTDHKLSQQKMAEIKHFAQVHAIHNGLAYRLKLPNGELSTVDYSKPPQKSWEYATDLVNTAFNQGQNNGRTTPNDTDWLYAKSVASGEVAKGWWD